MSPGMKRTIVYLAAIVCIAGRVHADETIRSVQQSLKDQGFYYGNVTGDKSAETTAAIRRYQIRNGLQVTGEISPETLNSLNVSGNSNSAALSQPPPKQGVTQSNTARPDAASAQQSPPDWQGVRDRQPEMNWDSNRPAYNIAPRRVPKRMVVAEVQRQLVTRGHYRGRVDGRYGRQTALALREFQFVSGLPPTGRLDMSTLGALGLSNANLAYLEPASRPSEVWIPITKFKHGKWKVKWKKYHRGNGDDYPDEERAKNSDSWWNGEDRDD
jgi:peptidoglycan hydrolase-like protein with peptidoglycan-binding domain